MNSKKIILLSLSFLAVIFLIAVFLLGYPLVLDLSKQEEYTTTAYQKGDTIKPFEKFDFDKGEWIAYLFISKDDEKDFSKKMPNGSRFKTTDVQLLMQMQKEWIFIYTGADIATVTSSIILYNNGKQVFNSGIVLSESLQGLQSRRFGWLAGCDLLVTSCSQFKKIYSPVIILK